jgi:beta-glucosidase
MWEHDSASPCVESSGDACDHYHRYPTDIALLAELGFNSYRFSIEWARIEPEEGEFSRAQLDHYRRMLATCHENGVSPTVTFHHFSSPRWIAARGSWAEASTIDRFVRFCERACFHLGDLIARACTINEPNVVASHGYQDGVFPPGKRDPDAASRASANFIDAHRRAYDVLKEGPGEYEVGMTLAMTDYQPVGGGEDELERIRRGSEDTFLDAMRGDDFIGVQTYTRNRVGPQGVIPPEADVEVTLMGWEYYPHALEATIRRAWAVTGGRPIVVTENGIATRDDRRRIDFVRESLSGVGRCIDDGIGVRGYHYWSALDNFEWALGYAPTFGLIEVDRTSLERRLKASAKWLGSVARDGILLPPPEEDEVDVG